jgi:hypothetical protein
LYKRGKNCWIECEKYYYSNFQFVKKNSIGVAEKIIAKIKVE